MTLFQDNLSPYLTVVEQGSTPASPSAGDQKLFIRTSDHLLCYINSSGTVTPVAAAASGSITASGYTQNTARLLGRTTASAGAIEEITVGSGLSLSAGSLTATGASTAHGCALYNSAATATSPLPCDTELFDTDGYHSTVSNTSRITIPTGLGGKYLVTFSATTSGGVARLMKNGSTSPFVGPNSAGQAASINTFSVIIALAQADYIEVNVSSGTWGHASAFEAQIQFSAAYLGA